MLQKEVRKNYCHKKYITKITLIVLVQVKKLIALEQLKRIKERIKYWNWFYIFDEHAVANCRMVNPENCKDLS